MIIKRWVYCAYLLQMIWKSDGDFLRSPYNIANIKKMINATNKAIAMIVTGDADLLLLRSVGRCILIGCILIGCIN